jgi:ABC-type nitrate/sulfonate/bicarbonate transport system ATPase subunit
MSAPTEAASGAIVAEALGRTYVDSYGHEVEALRGVDLVVRPGEFISLIGPSGCGKTTLLRLIAGLDRPQAGRILLDGEEISGPSHERGLVFQLANLFPWETIEGNIASGLKARGVYRGKRAEVQRYVDMTGLKGFEKTYPHQVSGGMAQRASLARALINDPKVLLLDEPLGALDAFTRMDLQDKLLELWKERGTTTILVTHDVDEAVYLSDRIVVMTPRPGRIEEVLSVGLPRPRSRGDAGFLELRTRILEMLHFVSRTKEPEYFL